MLSSSKPTATCAHGTNDRVTIEGTMGGSDWRIEQVQFADGIIWSFFQLLDFAAATVLDDEALVDTTDVDNVSGGVGNDYLNGRHGNDILSAARTTTC